MAADMMMMCCACCGKAEVDEINLRKCNACKSVRYCSVKCQKGHWPQHKKACKKAAELRDEVLFKQPESTHHEDCPICCLPLLMDTHYSIMSCCGKKVCSGCADANIRYVNWQGLWNTVVHSVDIPHQNHLQKL